MNNIAIIGGGASGLMAALFAARNSANVIVYEHNNGVGKKILASGNGRCNIINTSATPDDYAGKDPSFIAYALKQMNFHYFQSLCHSIGLILDIKEDGRCYPLSNEAKSVQQALMNAVLQAGATILTEHKVMSLSKKEAIFTVVTDQGSRPFDKVLIATGSEAAPQLGASADGYIFAAHFGHCIHPAYPSLVQLHLASKYPSKMAGIKITAEVSLIIDGKVVQKVTGDTLFASYGISGLAILDISEKASHALLNKQRVSIRLNLLPRYGREELETILKNLFTAIPAYTLESSLCGILPAKIVSSLLSEASLDATADASSLTTKEIKKLVHLIGEWKFEVNGTHGFKHAEVSGGGIDTAQINPKTMESTLISGLYFAGEVMDIVGKRGGYNFHFAWASGMIAGKEMAK